MMKMCRINSYYHTRRGIAGETRRGVGNETRRGIADETRRGIAEEIVYKIDRGGELKQ